MDERARAIGRRVGAFIESDGASSTFDDLALEVFAYQYERCRPYRVFCDRRGRSPATVRSWTDVPPVPAEAFVEVVLACEEPVRAFRTSGTTRGVEDRGVHYVADPSLYELSLTTAFRRYVLPDRARIRILSLVPSLEEQPESSLSYMAATLLEQFGDAESRTYARHRRVLLGAFFAALQRASAANEPALLLGTTIAFIPVLTAASDAGLRCFLPPGSRLVDTGGMKGMGTQFDDGALVAQYRDVFGLPAAACVNEYGMTELLSQHYNDDLVRLIQSSWVPAREGPARAIKRAPHWMRSRVLDPDTLEDAERGVLAHVDLANCHSVMAVLTADLAARAPDGFTLLGRRTGAGARGCSIAMDEWLA